MKNVLVYGVGKFFESNKKVILENYNIIGFIDRFKDGFYDSKPIFKSSNVNWGGEYDQVIIMLANVEQYFSVINDLVINGCDYRKIILGVFHYGRYKGIFEDLNATDTGGIEIVKNNIHCRVSSVDEFNNVKEVLVDECYNYKLNNKKGDIILDVGTNIGDAIMYFLQMDNAEKVYGFEPFEKTFNDALTNFDCNEVDKSKLEMFRFGLSTCDEERIIHFNKNMTCAQSTIENVRDKAFSDYINMGLVDSHDEITETIYVKQASSVIGSIIKDNPDRNIVLKMDCEGEEYGIMEDLYNNRVLQKIDFIMMEWHYKGKDFILDYLNNAGFSWWTIDKSKEMGLIYAFK